MLNSYAEPRLPSEAECWTLLTNTRTPPNVINHCKLVARLGLAIASSLTRCGYPLNFDLIRTAALLHDLAKGSPHHARAGAGLLVDYPEVAQIVAEHMDICLKPEDPLAEKEIVYLADKLVTDDQIGCLRERLRLTLAQHTNNQMAINNIKRRFSNAESIQTRIEAIIRMPLSELWKTNLEG